MKTVMINSFGGPEVLELVDIPMPMPNDDEVLVRAHAFGVGRPDALMRQGRYKWSPPLPFSPGNQLAGEIVEPGGSVENLRRSQRVLVNGRDLPQRGGCYAEYVTVPADSLYCLPDSVSFEDAVCLANYEVAATIMKDMVGPHIPKSALVVGAAGGVGSALVQLSKLQGMTVFASVSTAEKKRFVESLGADHVIDRTENSLTSAIQTLTDGAGVDLVLDHVGGATLKSYFGLLANWGTVVSYGALAEESPGDIYAELRKNVAKSPSLRFFSIHSYDGDKAGRRAIVMELIDLFAKGQLKPAIAARFRLDEVRSAHDLLDSGSACGRIVMAP